MHLCASKPKDVKGNKREICFTSAAWLMGLSHSRRLLFGLSQKWKSKAQFSLNTIQIIQTDFGPGPD